MLRRIRSWLAVIGLAAVLPLAQSAEPADVVFVNGQVYTADARDSVRQAFAVRGNRFVAVGTNDAVRELIGPDTRVIDLQGRFVSPGLADAHFHNEGGGRGIDLSRVRSMAELLVAVRAAADAAPPDGVVVSNSDWHEAQLVEQRLPTATELDRAAPNNPVVLVRGGHSYILNSVALRKWSISRDTPVPEGGVISRDATGNLTGEVIDAAKRLVSLPPPPPVTIVDVVSTQKILNAYGITAVRVPGFYKGDTLQAYRLLRETADVDKLTLRYVVYLPGFGMKTASDVQTITKQWGLQQDAGDSWLRVGGVKLGVDGGFEGARMSTPYAEPYGKGGNYSGVRFIAPGQFQEVVGELNRLDWRLTTHAAGDAALDEVLDAYDAADRDGPIVGKRWSIEHAFIVRPDQLVRLRRLGISLSVQNHLYLAAPILEKYWGRVRADQVTPLKTIIDAGLIVAGGTDSPVVPFNPFWELYHFLSRDTISAGVYGAEERVASRTALLRLVTINYAILIGEQADKGSIEPGKLADFAILTDSFLTAPPESIREMKALATYVDGREVYRAPNY